MGGDAGGSAYAMSKFAVPKPALAMTRSSFPQCRTDSATARSTSPSRVTSQFATSGPGRRDSLGQVLEQRPAPRR